MATSYTSLLGLALPVTGELSGTWGDTVNNAITSLLDTAVAGTTTVSADTTLTTTSGAANQARSAIILASGHVANITITAPAQSKIYTVINASGTYTVTFRGVGPTTGITLGANEKALLAWNGSDFVRIGGSGGSGVFSSITNTSLTSGRVVYSTTGGLETDSANLLFNGTTLTANTLNLTNALGTSYGGTGLTSFTSGGVVYASSSSALTTGSALTFDGTTFGIGVNTLFDNAKELRWKNASGVARPVLQIYSDNNLYLDSEDGAQIYRTSGTERMRLTSTGLGIGTSSPGYKLDVAGSVRSTGTILIDSSAGATQTALQVNDTSTNAYTAIKATSDGNGNGVLGLYFTNTETIHLAGWSGENSYFNAGNVGIGTSSPGATLDVNGATRIRSDFYVYGTGDRFNVFPQAAGNGAQLVSTNNANSAYSQLLFDGSPLVFNVAGTERMRLDSSGNLGIGTTSPGYKLSVNDSGTGLGFTNAASGSFNIGLLAGTGSAVAYIYQRANANLLFGTNNTTQMTLDSSGNLGVGTTSPLSRGHFVAASNLSDDNTITLGFTFGADSVKMGSIGTHNADGSNGGLLFSTSASGTLAERMRLDSSGNLIVGGTSAALGLVSVQGTGSYDAISAETSSSTTSSYATSVIRKTSTPASGSSTTNFIGTREFRAKTQSGTYKTPVQLLAGSITSSNDDNLWGTLQVNVNGYSTTLGNFTQLQLLLGSGSSPRFDVVCADGFGGTYTATQTLDTYFRPGQDNYSTLGQAAKRWTTVYATTGTINTSDRNDKQDIEELSAAEQRVAVQVKGLIRKFRFKDSVAAKGDNARIHFGVIAQDVQGAFTAEGLDASRYGLFCSDTFKAIDGKAVEKDENDQYPEGAIDYTRLGVRYEELLAFVISAI